MWQTHDVAEEGAVVFQHESFERKQALLVYSLFYAPRVGEVLASSLGV
jgi:hypothetical protein